MDKKQLEELEQFVDLCKLQPSVLQMPELSFFRDWLESLGATMPTCCKAKTTESSGPEPPPASKMEVESSSSSSEEDPIPDESSVSELEDDAEGVLEDIDEDEAADFGDPDLVVDDDSLEKAEEKRSEAQQKFSEGNWEEAIGLFTECIKLNPHWAPVLSKRAACFIRLRRPHHAIHDCDHALEINPDSAQAYKWRGIANRMLGKWEKAYMDLTYSNKLDFDDDTCEALKLVEQKAKRIMEHNRKLTRHREDKELHERRRRVHKAQKAQEKARRKDKKESKPTPFPEGTHSGSEGVGGIPGGAAFPEMFKDPDMMSLLQDPEFLEMMQDVMKSPLNAVKYKDNPKFAKVMKLIGQFNNPPTCGTSSPDEKPTGMPRATDDVD